MTRLSVRVRDFLRLTHTHSSTFSTSVGDYDFVPRGFRTHRSPYVYIVAARVEQNLLAEQLSHVRVHGYCWPTESALSDC